MVARCASLMLQLDSHGVSSYSGGASTLLGPRPPATPTNAVRSMRELPRAREKVLDKMEAPLRSLPLRFARTVVACASFALAFGAWTEARAGTLPDISGTWYANGNRAAACRITQSGNSVSLTNEQGATATGNFVDPSTLSTNWGFFGGAQITGNISSDLRTITWSNGTYWSRPSAPPIPTVPTPTPRPTPTPEPLRVGVLPIANNDTNPIYVYAASLTNGNQAFTFAQCVSYRNVTTKVVTDVDFTFVVTNNRGGVEANLSWADKGTFTPPVNIDNHCYRGRLWDPRTVRRMTHESVRLKQVTFADGTVWKPGMPFLRGYTASGSALAQHTVQTHSSSGSHDEDGTGTSLGLVLENRDSGVYVKFVAPGSAGALAGIRQGDRILSLGSNDVASVADVQTILGMTSAGTLIPISLERAGETLNVSVSR